MYPFQYLSEANDLDTKYVDKEKKREWKQKKKEKEASEKSCEGIEEMMVKNENRI